MCLDLLSLLLFSNLLVFDEAIGREVRGSPQVYPSILILQLTHNACAMNQVSTAENTIWPIHSNHIIPLLLTGALKNERQHIMAGKSQVTCITGSTSARMKNVYITASMGSISERRHLLSSTLQHVLVNQGESLLISWLRRRLRKRGQGSDGGHVLVNRRCYHLAIRGRGGRGPTQGR